MSSVIRLNPSDPHRALLAANKPELEYRGGSVAQWQERVRPLICKAVLGNMAEDILRAYSASSASVSDGEDGSASGGDGVATGRTDAASANTGAACGNAVVATRVPLNVRSLWKRQHPLGSIEKIVFAAEADCDIPAYVCLPKNAEAPYTWLICLQGHSTGMHNSIAVVFGNENEPFEAQGDRDFAITCMKRGMAALCIEQRGFGERRESSASANEKTTCRDAVMHALMLGRTLQGERVYDVDRAIDYLLTRDDVAPGRIGVMGNSAGGTVALMAAALLPRIDFAMPSASFCTFEDSIMAMHHCECNYVPGLLSLAEAADIAGLVAPRPLVFVNGDEDPIFPLPGARKAIARAEEIYRAAGAEHNLKWVIGNGGHRFYADDAWPVLLSLL